MTEGTSEGLANLAGSLYYGMDYGVTTPSPLLTWQVDRLKAVMDQVTLIIQPQPQQPHVTFARGTTSNQEEAFIPKQSDNGIKEPHLLEQLIRLYSAYMAYDVRSPVPHLAGPPGVGKSESVEKLAELLGVRLHVVNVSRISPLELEGVQMPQGLAEEMHLKLLHNPLWTNLQEGDIVLFDEFLRGFPEVYNGLLDILSSRKVAGYELPKVFFVAASNSVKSYDKALEDRLLHVFVPDIRRKGANAARIKVKELLIEGLGLDPKLRDSAEMENVIATEVDPMYEILDMFKHTKRADSTALKGRSVRNLIGQGKLRRVASVPLQELIALNNQQAVTNQKYQTYLYLEGPVSEHVYLGMKKLVGNPRLTETQETNLRLNIQFIDMNVESAIGATPTIEEDDDEPEFS